MTFARCGSVVKDCKGRFPRVARDALGFQQAGGSRTTTIAITTMRKIEVSMNAAISECLDWRQGNTRVTFSSETNESDVYLYESLIASVGEDYVKLFSGGFRTSTTKSRLNAVLAEHGCRDMVYQRNGQWYVESEGSVLPFTEGMTLSGV